MFKAMKSAAFRRAAFPGSFRPGYAIMIVMILIALVCFIIMGRTPDYDRGSK